MTDWIETYTGKHVNPLHMSVDDIDIKDIAHSLSNTCRYTGHCAYFYSVLSHSLHVYRILREYDKFRYPSIKHRNRTLLGGLLHDASEAYLADVSRPTKHQILQLVEIENKILGVVANKYNLHNMQWDYIHQADNIAGACEAWELMPSMGKDWEIDPIPPDLPPHSAVLLSYLPTEGEKMFLSTFHELEKDVW